MNTTLKSFLLLSTLFCGSLALAVPPVITNVTASQRAGTKLVDIYYDIVDEDGDLMKVRVEISDNDGVRYSVPAFSLTGDIGDNIESGTQKHIVWDAGTDWDGEYSDLMRVKVFAIDAKGFPGMEWGNEVPPGGFLLGQDGGAEGSGPSRHVNIPWSYWLTKYEITRQQYCDFLNTAIITGHVKRDGTTKILSTIKTTSDTKVPPSVLLCNIGDSKEICWNVNNFEVVDNKGNYPVSVTWYGALAFCDFYGYDLPTHAEWEKAARGPDHDDQDEHLLYPWGNDIDSSCAACYTDSNSNSYSSILLKPVGYYDGNQTPIGNDMINGYGLYDIIGNAAEWTRTSDSVIESYPQKESLFDGLHTVWLEAKRILKGKGAHPIYNRDLDYSGTIFYGFRPIRRLNADIERENLVCVLKEDFNTWAEKKDYNSSTITTSDGEWKLSTYAYVKATGVDETMAIETTYSSSSSIYITLPKVEGKIAFIRCNVKSSQAGETSAYIRCYSTDFSGPSTRVILGQEIFKKTEILVNFEADQYMITLGDYLIIDDLEVWVYPEEETEE